MTCSGGANVVFPLLTTPKFTRLPMPSMPRAEFSPCQGRRAAARRSSWACHTPGALTPASAVVRFAAAIGQGLLCLPSVAPAGRMGAANAV